MKIFSSIDDEKKTSISNNATWQLIGKFFLQGIIFFTTPIFTRILTPADYGITSLFNTWVSICTLLIGLQTYGTIGNARLKFVKEEFNKYLSSILTISVISFVILLVVSICFGRSLSKIMGLSFDLILLVLFQSFFNYCFNFYITKLDQLKLSKRSAILSFIQSLLCIIFSLLFVYFFPYNKAKLKILGNILPTLIISIILIIIIYFKGKKIYNKIYYLYCLKLSLPLVVHGLASVIFIQCDKIMLNKLQDNSTLGIYTTAYNLCSILVVIYTALNTSWIPFYYDLQKENSTKNLLNHCRRLILLFALICAGFSLLSIDVYKIMVPENYWDGCSLLPIFTISTFFMFLYIFPSNFEFFSEKTFFLPIGTSFSMILNIVLNYFFIKKYGMVGAAITTLMTNFTLFIFHEIIANIIGREKYEKKNSIYLIAICVLLIAIFISYIFKDNYLIRWLFAIIIALYIIFNIYKNKALF